MTLDGYNAFCRALPHARHVVQWGGAHVWKVGAKVFAICWVDDGNSDLLVTFKCSPMSFDLLREQSGLRPAPYLASRGLKWIQRTGSENMDDDTLRDYLAASHRIVAAGLPKRMQLELGLEPANVAQKSNAKSNAIAKPGTKPKPDTKTKSTKQRDAQDLRGENQ